MLVHPILNEKMKMSNMIGRSIAVHVAFFVAYCLFGLCGSVGAQPSGENLRAFSFEALEANRVGTARSYLPFLNVDSLHCGIYCLDAGAKDGQNPHQQDEIYYVESGVAKINIEGKDYDLKKGSIVFVPANAPHHFHTITENLKTLVFFSKGPVAKTEKKPAEKNDQKLQHSTDSAMIFNATMDSVTDANLFDSHGWICTAESIERKTTKDGNHVKEVSIVDGAGVSGDCLRFSAKTKQVLFYKSRGQGLVEEESDIKILSKAKTAVFLIGGSLGLYFGGKWIVGGATEVATLLGVSESVIALTLVAGATAHAMALTNTSS